MIDATTAPAPVRFSHCTKRRWARLKFRRDETGLVGWWYGRVRARIVPDPRGGNGVVVIYRPGVSGGFAVAAHWQPNETHARELTLALLARDCEWYERRIAERLAMVKQWRDLGLDPPAKRPAGPVYRKGVMLLLAGG